MTVRARTSVNDETRMYSVCEIRSFQCADLTGVWKAETDLAPLRIIGARLGLGPRNLLLASDRDADVRVGRTTSQLGALDASSAVELDLQNSDGRVWAGDIKAREVSWRRNTGKTRRNAPRGAPLSKDSRLRVKTLGSYIMGLKGGQRVCQSVILWPSSG